MSVLFSVAICTVDRCTSLYNALQSLEKITFNSFEVIIIDASSNDDTAEMIAQISGLLSFPIQIHRIQIKNISCSRNAAIRLASGSIIAFLDDDAIPPPNWLDRLFETYSIHGKNCAGVGGAVRDMTRPAHPLQFRRGITSVLSETITIRPPRSSDHNQAEGVWYSGLMGVNSSFRKEALEKINGYDEFFDYFLDETDVCLRLIQAGYEIHYSDVVVDHYPQPSHNRKDQKHLTCWYAIAKNTTYFALKHGRHKFPFPIFITRLFSLLMRRCFLRIVRLKLTHNLPNRVLLRYVRQAIAGLKEGWQSGLRWQEGDLPSYGKVLVGQVSGD